eukprot:TRINITY_DN76575_c0_g1_i1.p1 TRINITY_DN76575_c0_g1~~TRINITY_DN76575_c0_g1_i1.p1  ORF type:complete len:156 (+),score=45.44 TRINITY_DN76575_c0_g1_i1:31-498(+)
MMSSTLPSDPYREYGIYHKLQPQYRIQENPQYYTPQPAHLPHTAQPPPAVHFSNPANQAKPCASNRRIQFQLSRQPSAQSRQEEIGPACGDRKQGQYRQQPSLAGVTDTQLSLPLYNQGRRASTQGCLTCELISMGSSSPYSDNSCSQCGRDRTA